MLTYKLCGVLVVLGCVALVAGVFLGISPSANYLVEISFALFAISAIVFVVYVLQGLWREFKEST
jgi:hypothetical protein